MKKNIFLVLFFLLLSIFSYGQNTDWARSEAFPSYVTYVNLVTHDLDGNLIVCGEVTGGGGTYIIKYDNLGNKIWQNHYTGYNTVQSLCCDSDKNIYAIISFGHLNINGEDYSPHGNFRRLIVKYDPLGNILWVKETELGMILSKDLDPQGNLIGTGWSVGTTHLENGITLTASEIYGKMFLGRFNSLGECTWAIQDDGSNGSPMILNAGKMFVCSYFYDSITLGKGVKRITFSEPGSYAGYLAKYEIDGSLSWAKEVYSSSGVAPDLFGNLYSFENDQISPNTIKLIKYNANGDVIWEKTPISCSSGYKFGMKSDDYGNVFVTGGFANTMTIGDTSITTNSNIHTYIAKIDSSGKLKWIIINGGTGIVGSKDIDIYGHEIYVTGDLFGTVTFGNSTISQAGGGNFTLKIVDTDTVTPVKEVPPTNVAFNVFPNPSGTIFNVSYESKATNDITINVKNQLGQSIIKKQFPATNILHETFNLSSQGKGVYFIELISGEAREVRKIIVE